MRKIVYFILVIMLTSCTTQQAKDILEKLFFENDEYVDETPAMDDNETEYVEYDSQTESESNQFVDLGLSVKWATCNVGANSPEEYGDYYTFADAQKLDSGEKRVPSIEEIQELIDKCNWTWTTQNGVNGCKVTSKKNGNSIFLPAAGDRNGSDVGSYGFYWSSSIDDNKEADYLNFQQRQVFVNYYDNEGLYYGLSVRLVQDVE